MSKYDTLNQKWLDLFQQQDFQSALEIFQEIITEKPTYEFALINMWLCYDALGEFQKAVDAYNEVISSSKTLQTKQPSDIYFFKAVSLYNMENFSEAIEIFERDINYHGYDVQMRSTFFIGTCYMYVPDYEQAIIFFKKVLSVYKYHLDAVNNLGTCYLELWRYDIAKELFQVAINTDPNFIQAQKNLEIATKKLG